MAALRGGRVAALRGLTGRWIPRPAGTRVRRTGHSRAGHPRTGHSRTRHPRTGHPRMGHRRGAVRAAPAPARPGRGVEQAQAVQRGRCRAPPSGAGPYEHLPQLASRGAAAGEHQRAQGDEAEQRREGERAQRAEQDVPGARGDLPEARRSARTAPSASAGSSGLRSRALVQLPRRRSRAAGQQLAAAHEHGRGRGGEQGPGGGLAQPFHLDIDHGAHLAPAGGTGLARPTRAARFDLLVHVFTTPCGHTWHRGSLRTSTTFRAVSY